jgi:hypothetical protein
MGSDIATTARGKQLDQFAPRSTFYRNTLSL